MENENQGSNRAVAPMPQYQSHKKVWALKIMVLEPIEGEGGKLSGMMMYPVEPGFAPIALDGAYMSKHHPEVGGYYVVYADGYKSYSPAQAFEEGNRLIEKRGPSRFRTVYRTMTASDGVKINAIKDVADQLEMAMAAASKDPRQLAVALTNLEQSVMWAVKAATA